MADSDDGYLDEYCYYNEDDDDEADDDDDRRWDNRPYMGTYCGLRPSFLFSQNYSLPTPRYITQEEADRNAKELLEEEKREKDKADKKRLKKKRQKDRKRQQKLQEAENEKTSVEDKMVTVTRTTDNIAVQKVEADSDNVTHQDSTTSASDDDLDLRSTFVRQAQKKMENKPKPERRERTRERATERSNERAPERETMPDRSQERAFTIPPTPPQPQNDMNILDRFKLQESLDLANIGNNMASKERFSEALHYYTEAIKLNPSEFRILGNRSYVYDRLGQYKEALWDAENALKQQPHFLKGHFRKGKALKGLKQYSESIAAFQQVLLFDVNHVEAAAEIVECQQRMQEVMPSTRVKILSTAPLSPLASLPRVKILSTAPLSPLATPPISVIGQNSKVFVPRNIYNTKCDTNKSAAEAVVSRLALERASGVAVQSKLYPIWVGNVTDKITENLLRSKFEPFGLLHSVRILYSRTCAFINYTSKDSAEAAFRSLQGLTIEGTTFVLQLRNPEHNKSEAPPGWKNGK